MRVALALALVLVLVRQCDAYIGVNWGRQTAQRLVPSQVVDLMLQNGVRNVRIYTTQDDILQAFQGSDINLTITFSKNTIPPNISLARDWVLWKYGNLTLCNITSVIIGGGTYAFDLGAPDYDFSWRGLNYVQAALNESGLGPRMKTNFVHYSGLLIRNITRPSQARFRPEITLRMLEFLQFLRRNDAPFMVDLYPIADLQRCGLDPSFAFPDSSSALAIPDVHGALYTNGFHWQYDCFVWALEKLNASDIRILVSEVGWPTDGYPGATAAAAERFYKHLLPMLASSRGTPKRPGAPIDVYISNLIDEPKMPAVMPPYTRHMGLYRTNGEPKFKVDLSGRGRDIYPTRVKGIMRMPDRWCVFNGNTSDMLKVRRQMERACAQGDCTTLAPAASCSNIGLLRNVSYVFNVFFQTHFQDEDACHFDGLAYITDQDPSTPACVFPVEVVKGKQVYDGPTTLTPTYPGPFRAVVLLFLFVFVLLLYINIMGLV